MAKIFPKEIPLDVKNDPKRRAERILFDGFKELLNDEIIIYYSKNWRNFQIDKYNRNSIFINGEADFIIIWPTYGILIIECKGGGIEIKEGNFFSGLILPDGATPIVPVQAGPRSDRMSPNRFDATTTSNQSG